MNAHRSPHPTSVALFGTSADPPTIGHRAVLKALADRYPLVATWASDNPLKDHGAPLAIRAELLSRVVQDLADPRVALVQDLSSPWAIDTLASAAQHWPGAALVLVVGSDLLAQIPRWRAADRLLPQLRLAVIPRRGWPLQAEDLETLRRLGARVDILPLTIEATASSTIRDHRAQGAEAIAQIPAAIRATLLQHRLYGSNDAPQRP
ncbi:MAG: nicotinate-nucleotide adenylyltransferase [Cyanobacteriota bacterium]